MGIHAITFTRLTGALGAQVDGVDLRTPLSDESFAAIHSGLMDHQVLFFRNQHLNDDQQLELARRFGTPSVYPIARSAGSTNPLTFIEDTPDKRPSADNWHTDMTFLPAPPKFAVLSACVIPPFGGDTLWASLYALYETLSPAMRALCRTLSVRHAPEATFWRAATAALDPDRVEQLKAELAEVTHPLVVTHPVTRRPAVFLSGDVFMEGIVGMHPGESELLLGFLRQLLDDPNHYVRWRWQPGDLVIWDERCTNHRALADHFPAHRLMRRCTVDGDVPLALG